MVEFRHFIKKSSSLKRQIVAIFCLDGSKAYVVESNSWLFSFWYPE